MTKLKSLINISLLILLVFSCKQKESKQTPELSHQTTSKEMQDSIINEHLINGAYKHSLSSIEYQNEIDKGLAKDSTIAYLWQQKAMPLYKQGKYELGTKYINKAVKFDRNNEWQEYRAFMTCIFSKRYKEAITDFEDCIRKYGNSYVMDHSYNFYIALSKIQLNQFAEAEGMLNKEISHIKESQGEDWIHHLDLFYLGISRYEQGKYKEAIISFDRALLKHTQFSEAFYYKSICEERIGNIEAAKKLLKEAKILGKQGYSINEDNSIYERYPYQIRWSLY